MNNKLRHYRSNRPILVYNNVSDLTEKLELDENEIVTVVGDYFFVERFPYSWARVIVGDMVGFVYNPVGVLFRKEMVEIEV